MPLTVRRATPADAPTLVEFNCRLAQESEGKTLDPPVVAAGVAAAFADAIKGPYYVAEEAGQILGSLQITFEWSDWRNGWLWWFQGVYVRPEARRCGVFRALFEHIHRLAVQDPNVLGLRLYVHRDNHAAQQTYQRLGMEGPDYLVLEKYPLRETSGQPPLGSTIG